MPNASSEAAGKSAGSSVQTSLRLPGRRNRARESVGQKALVAWCRNYGPPGAARIFAVNNGLWLQGDAGLRAKLANHYKAMGMRPSVPDLFLPVAKRGAFGFFIEMKREGEDASENQAEELGMLADSGYLVGVFDEWTVAQERIKWYLEGQRTLHGNMER